MLKEKVAKSTTQVSFSTPSSSAVLLIPVSSKYTRHLVLISGGQWYVFPSKEYKKQKVVRALSTKSSRRP